VYKAEIFQMKPTTYTTSFSRHPLDDLVSVEKGGSAPPPPAPPAPAPTAKQVEIRQQARDVNRAKARRRGMESTILAGSGMDAEEMKRTTLLGG